MTDAVPISENVSSIVEETQLRFRTLCQPSNNFSPRAGYSTNTIFNLTIFKPLAIC